MNRRDHEVVAHHTWLRRLARRLARSNARADDLIQDTYLTALRKAPPDGTLRPWLHAVMRKLAWGQLRSERRRTRREQAFAQIAPSSTALADALLDGRIEHDRLAAALARVPEPFHSTLVQRFLEGRSCADIARSTNVPAGTVRWRQARGLEQLRAQLEGRRQRAVWVIPFLGAGGLPALRGWNRLVSPWSGKLWLWLAVAVIAYAVGSSRVRPVAPVAVDAAPAVERGDVAVVLASSAADSVRADADETPRDPGFEREAGQSSAGGADVAVALTPATTAPAGFERALALRDRPLDALADDCRWQPGVGWVCPQRPRSDAAARSNPLCGTLQQAGATTFSHRALARLLGCPGPRPHAVRSPTAGKRAAPTPGGDPGSDGDEGDPITGCHAYMREDGVACTACVDTTGAARTICATAASRLPGPCFSVSAFDGGVVLLDPTTETIVYTSMNLDAVEMSSLGWTGNHLLGCDWTQDRVLVFDLATGATTALARGCDAVTAMGGQIYVQSLLYGSLREYPDLAALIEDRPARILPGPFASRLGPGHGRLLAAWHAADEVLAVDLATASSEPIPLHDYDGWIYGLFENADVRLVIPQGGGMHLYDTASGERVGNLFDSMQLRGLACATDPD
jgi:RNA polymerase sigma-70 factor (ECF subfamily)